MLQVISTDLLLAGTQSQQDPPTAEPPGKTTSRGSSDVTRCHLWLPTPPHTPCAPWQPQPRLQGGTEGPVCACQLLSRAVPAAGED